VIASQYEKIANIVKIVKMILSFFALLWYHSFILVLTSLFMSSNSLSGKKWQ
jgi:hypothetical protein